MLVAESSFPANWEKERLTPQQKGQGIAENLGLFITGDKPTFYRYFISTGEQTVIEKEFIIAAGIDETALQDSEAPVCVMQVDDTRLYRWTGNITNEIKDVNYQACHGDEEPFVFSAT